MSHKGCLSVTKYFLFLFNLFFFVSIWLVGEGQAGDRGRGPGRGRAEGVTLPVLSSSLQILGSLLFSFGLWILFDQNSFSSTLGEFPWLWVFPAL